MHRYPGDFHVCYLFGCLRIDTRWDLFTCDKRGKSYAIDDVLSGADDNYAVLVPTGDAYAVLELCCDTSSIPSTSLQQAFDVDLLFPALYDCEATAPLRKTVKDIDMQHEWAWHLSHHACFCAVWVAEGPSLCDDQMSGMHAAVRECADPAICPPAPCRHSRASPSVDDPPVAPIKHHDSDSNRPVLPLLLAELLCVG